MNQMVDAAARPATTFNSLGAALELEGFGAVVEVLFGRRMLLGLWLPFRLVFVR